MKAEAMRTEKLSRLRRRSRREAGSLMLFFVAAVGVMLAFMGLAFDASYFYYYKRRMQTAADAAAIAGAQELMRQNSAAVTTSARNDSSMNSFAHGSSGIDVAVYNPPISGTKVGNTSFVEVVITQDRPTWFMRILRRNTATIKARAVAGLVGADGCVYALNRDTSNVNNGFFANGTTNSTFGCGIRSNAHFRTVGGGCVITPSASYTGNYTNSSSADSDCGPGSISAAVPVVDPIAGRYPAPATSPCTYNSVQRYNTGTSVTLSPGVYCGGIDLGGSLASATFLPGRYVLVGGGLTIGSGVAATGTGVTFYNTFATGRPYQEIRITSSSTVSFSAPTTGADKAMLFWQNPLVNWSSNNGSIITGGSNSVFEGILYFPTTDLTYSGNSSSTNPTGGYTSLIGYNIKIAGTSQINADYSVLGGNPIQMSAFAE